MLPVISESSNEEVKQLIKYEFKEDSQVLPDFFC